MHTAWATVIARHSLVYSITDSPYFQAALNATGAFEAARLEVARVATREGDLTGQLAAAARYAAPSRQVVAGRLVPALRRKYVESSRDLLAAAVGPCGLHTLTVAVDAGSAGGHKLFAAAAVSAGEMVIPL